MARLYTEREEMMVTVLLFEADSEILAVRVALPVVRV